MMNVVVFTATAMVKGFDDLLPQILLTPYDWKFVRGLT